MTAHLLRIALFLPAFALAACDLVKDSTPQPAPQTPGATLSSEGTAAATTTASTITSSPIPAAKARSAAEMNTTTQNQRAEAAAAPTRAETRLGTTVASLGDPTLPGFWIKTPLAKSESDGRIVNPANGKSAKVRLMPLGGAASGGSQVSLPALQLIGVSLTDLPTIEVYGN